MRGKRAFPVGIFVLAGVVLMGGCTCTQEKSGYQTEVGQEEPEIAGITWQWVESRYGNDTEAVSQDPSRYTLLLNTDGTISVKADCNMAGGTWHREEGRITITVTHSTRAMCPPDSLDQAFLKDLDRVAIPFFRDGNLHLDMIYDSGTMRFVK